MNKPIVNLRNWTLKTLHNYYYLEGIADYHPNLGSNVIITQTSNIENGKIENDVFIAITQNTIYHCPLKYIKIDDYIGKAHNKEDNILNTILQCEIDIAKGKNDGILVQNIKQLMEIGKKELIELEEQENERLIENAKKYENSLYVDIYTLYGGSKGAFYLNGKSKIIIPLANMGFEHNVNYQTNDFCFKYIPNGTNLNICKWSENLEYVILKNSKEHIIKVFDNFEIQPKETLVLKREDYKDRIK